jgi:hypothetical protein
MGCSMRAPLTGSLIAALIFVARNFAYGEDMRASACLEKLRSFIQETDRLFVENANNVLVFDRPIKTYLPANGCDVDAAITAARTSKFFSELFDSYASYTVSFKNARFIVSFSLRKDTGDIEYPAARTRIRLGD